MSTPTSEQISSWMCKHGMGNEGLSLGMCKPHAKSLPEKYDFNL
jgi:hypothetical protein